MHVLVVEINNRVKIRFSNGEELLVKILDNIHNPPSPDFPLNKEAPLGKALLGRSKGEQIAYKVRDSIYRVTILDIYQN